MAITIHVALDKFRAMYIDIYHIFMPRQPVRHKGLILFLTKERTWHLKLMVMFLITYLLEKVPLIIVLPGFAIEASS